MKNKLLRNFAFLFFSTLWVTIIPAQEIKKEKAFSPDTSNAVLLVKKGTSQTKEKLSYQLQYITLQTNKSTKALDDSGSNLLFFQPDGWDNKLVVSTTAGTHTSTSTINDSQIVYIDFAFANDGTSDITTTFVIEIFIDNRSLGTIDVEGLGYNKAINISDLAIDPFSAGSHTLKIVVDAHNNISETNEGDNECTRLTQFTHTSDCANLYSILPDTWDNNLVLSTVIGTNTNASTIYANQTIYADWAIRNYGGCNISESFKVNIYVDNILENTFTVDGLNSYSIISVFDREIGPLTAGTHTFKVIVDASNDVNESNEGDNEYSRTIIVVPSQTSPEINVVPTSITINEGDTNKSFTIQNIGTGNLNITLLTDNKDWLSASGNPGTPFTISSSGSQEVSIAVNWSLVGSTTQTGTITIASNDSDEPSVTVQVTAVPSSAPCVNVTPYKPNDWDDKIVISTVSGTHTCASNFYDDQDIYLDWASINDGTCDISETFYIDFYVDDVLKSSWAIDGLESEYYTYNTEDLIIGKLSAGTHIFKIVSDADDNVLESNELDNVYTHTIAVFPHTGIELPGNTKNIRIYPNPVSNQLFIEFDGNKESIEFTIMNSVGQTIYSGELSDKVIVQTTTFIPGFYFIKFDNGNIIEYRKIIKE